MISYEDEINNNQPLPETNGYSRKFSVCVSSLVRWGQEKKSLNNQLFPISTQDKYLMKKDERIICCYIRDGRAMSRRIRDIVLF